MARSKKRRIDTSGGPDGGSGSLTHSPFAALRRAAEPEVPDPAAPAEAKAADASGPEGPCGGPVGGRIEVRHERKGRGGKTVTVARWLQGGPGADERAALARRLASALGTGARVEGDTIVLQGDLVDRLVDALEKATDASIVRGTGG